MLLVQATFFDRFQVWDLDIISETWLLTYSTDVLENLIAYQKNQHN